MVWRTVQRELTHHGIAQSLPSLLLILDLSKPVPAAVGAAGSVTGSTAGNDPESRLSATAVMHVSGKTCVLWLHGHLEILWWSWMVEVVPEFLTWIITPDLSHLPDKWLLILILSPTVKVSAEALPFFIASFIWASCLFFTSCLLSISLLTEFGR